MSEVGPLISIVIVAILLTGCVSTPTKSSDASGSAGASLSSGQYSLTSNPPGAWVLVRDCPSCKDKFLAETPYSGKGPKLGLTGKYLSAALDGHQMTQPLEVKDSGRRQFHFNLIPSTAASAAAASRDSGALRVTSIVRTTSYRSALTKENAVYEPMLADTEFLVVSATADVNPEPSNGGGSVDPNQLGGYEAYLVGAGSNRQRKPVVSHRRLGKKGLEIEYAFSVPRSESGPYRLQVGGSVFPLASSPATASSSTVAAGGARPSRLGMPVTAAAVGTAAIAAVGGTVLDTGKGFRLCAKVERYELCGNGPCRSDGLMSKTSLSCRESSCVTTEIPGSDTWEFGSLASCVSACRKAQAEAVSRGSQGAVPVYCMH